MLQDKHASYSLKALVNVQTIKSYHLLYDSYDLEL